MKSTEEGYLPLSPLLSSNAKKTSTVPKLTSSSLISLVQLADDGCTIVLDKCIITAIRTNKLSFVAYVITKMDCGISQYLKQKVMSNNYQTPNIHPIIYPSRRDIATTFVSLQNRNKRKPLPIKKVNMVSSDIGIDDIIQRQLRLDRKNSRIIPHLRNLDSLVYELRGE